MNNVWRAPGDPEAPEAQVPVLQPAPDVGRRLREA